MGQSQYSRFASPASSLHLGVGDADPVQWETSVMHADSAAMAGNDSVISRVSSLENWAML